jgi:hypothetical protein
MHLMTRALNEVKLSGGGGCDIVGLFRFDGNIHD